MAETLGDLAGQHAAAGAVCIMDDGLQAYCRTAVERSLRFRNQLAVENILDLVVLKLALVDGGTFVRWWLREQPREVEALGLPVLHQLAAVEHLHLPDHLVEGAEAERSHQFADFLGDEKE